jgi:hypothetical protein
MSLRTIDQVTNFSNMKVERNAVVLYYERKGYCTQVKLEVKSERPAVGELHRRGSSESM